jgi:hypothetical protein
VQGQTDLRASVLWPILLPRVSQRQFLTLPQE